jgi:hypothetical protein
VVSFCLCACVKQLQSTLLCVYLFVRPHTTYHDTLTCWPDFAPHDCLGASAGWIPMVVSFSGTRSCPASSEHSCVVHASLLWGLLWECYDMCIHSYIRYAIWIYIILCTVVEWLKCW